MQFDDDRLPYEKPTLLCLTLEPGIVKGGSNDYDEYEVEQPTPEPLENDNLLL